MMARLTFEGNFCDIARCKDVKCPPNTACSQKQIWERLKQYEDTKRTPEQIEALEAAIMGKAVAQITEFEELPIARLRELAVADKEGRVIVLPCKGTDKLYVVGTKQIVECSIAEMYLMDDETIEYLVNFECIDNCDGCPFNSWERETVSDEYHCGGEYGDGSVSSKNFGETVFLTREEAEKALAEMEGKKDGTA